MTMTQIGEQIFRMKVEEVEDLALAMFAQQVNTIPIYGKYVSALGIDAAAVTSIRDIPFLPIQFFKTHRVGAEEENADVTLFESSGTSGQVNSRHYVNDIHLYEKSFLSCFSTFFGSVDNYCILGLLPSYLERGQSSLVYMVDRLIRDSHHPASGFYLHNHHELFATIRQLEESKQPALLFGVTYALLDFAERYSSKLNYVNIIETGGMKGRRQELLRTEVHTILKERFSKPHIYSEYGMTELLSQAYSLKDGVFATPPWMKVITRDLNDPFMLSLHGKGALNIIDLANIHSCCFIATDDVGEVYDDGSFTITGRLDHTDIRGCSLMAV